MINSLYMLMRNNNLLGNIEFYGTDINTKALECAQRVSLLNNNQICYVEDNLANSFSE